jgi:nucleoside 2-deoxyribosyltransferase
MKYYLAARYSRHAEMQGYARQLETIGHHVTSRWITAHGGTEPVSWNGKKIRARLEDAKKIALADLSDIDAAHCLIFFSEDGPNGSKGGRHVEVGYAIAKGKSFILIGEYDNIFSSLADVTYPKFSLFIHDLSGEAWRSKP